MLSGSAKVVVFVAFSSLPNLYDSEGQVEVFPTLTTRPELVRISLDMGVFKFSAEGSRMFVKARYGR